MSGLSLSRLRRRSERLMPDSAGISRPALVDDGAGGRTTTYTTVDAAVPCRVEVFDLRDVTAMAAMIQGGSETLRLQERKFWRLCVPWGTDIRRQDKVVIGNVTYIVVDMSEQGSHEAHLSVVLMEA